MAAEGRPYRGVLFCGMMFTESGPKVLEFNVRFGDPECQVLCSRLRSDLLDLLERAAKGELRSVDKIEWDPVSAMVVVMASKGYPGKYEKGSVIEGIDRANKIDGVKVFHAGTDMKDEKVRSWPTMEHELTGGRGNKVWVQEGPISVLTSLVLLHLDRRNRRACSGGDSRRRDDC